MTFGGLGCGRAIVMASDLGDLEPDPVTSLGPTMIRVIPTAASDWISVTDSELSASTLLSWAVRPHCGAVVSFCGTVRDSSSGQHDVIALEYETCLELAERSLAEIVSAARERWPSLGAVAIHHRLGRVALGETAVVVAVSSPHRTEAFEAAQYCIDSLKESVPMWKREVWEGGSAWSGESRPIAKIQHG